MFTGPVYFWIASRPRYATAGQLMILTGTCCCFSDAPLLGPSLPGIVTAVNSIPNPFTITRPWSGPRRDYRAISSGCCAATSTRASVQPEHLETTRAHLLPNSYRFEQQKLDSASCDKICQFNTGSTREAQYSSFSRTSANWPMVTALIG